MSSVASLNKRPLWLDEQDGSLSFSELFSDQRGHSLNESDCRPRTKSAAALYANRRNRLIQQKLQQPQVLQRKKNGLVIQVSCPIPIPGRQQCLTFDGTSAGSFENFVQERRTR